VAGEQDVSAPVAGGEWVGERFVTSS
jgi:hypothetical protein